MELPNNTELYKKRINTNSAYLNRIMAIIYTKCKCIPTIFYNQSGEEIENKIIQIADSSDNSVSIAKKNGSMRVALDGTNFILNLHISDNGEKYVYENKALGIQYMYSERDLDEVTQERVLIKHIGDDLYLRAKFYVQGDFIVISEFLQQRKDGSNRVALLNCEICDLDEESLLVYINEQVMEAMSEVEEEEIDNDSDIEPDEDEERALDEENEIDESIVPENDELYYANRAKGYKSVAYELPYDIKEFDDQDYKNYIMKLDGEDFPLDIDESGVSPIYVDEQEINESDSIYNADNSAYKIYYHDVIEDDELKEKVVDSIYEAVSIENQEIMDLVESINEIAAEYENAVKLIRARNMKDKANGKKRKKSNPDSQESDVDCR